jgi:hypothetical protein
MEVFYTFWSVLKLCLSEIWRLVRDQTLDPPKSYML